LEFEAEFPLEAWVTPVGLLIDSAVGLLLNLEAAQQGGSVLFSGEQNLLLKEGKRGLRRTPKMDFMRIKTDSCKARMYVYLARISKEMHMNCDVSVCLIPDTYIGMQSCIPAMWWR
jgi:hypothetical protein